MDLHKSPIVFGFDSYNTAGSIRCLGEAGIKPIVILVSDRKRNAIAKSKYINKIHIVDTIEQGIGILKKNYKSTSITYLFVTSDKIASALDLIFDELKNHFIFPNAGEEGKLNYWMDKNNMCVAASESGIVTPKSVEYHVGNQFPNSLSMPCIIKPSKSIKGSKQDITIINSINDVNEYLGSLHHTEDYIIQEYVKKECELLIIGCRTQSGNIFIPAHLIKTRWIGTGDDASQGWVKRGLPKNINKNAITQFLSKINYIGPFSIEFGVQDHMPFFYEINLRNDGTINYFTKVGVNLPLMFLTDSEDINYSKPDEALFVDEIGDFLNVIRGDLKFTDWINNLKKSSAHKYYDKHDKGPFMVFFPRMLRVVMATWYHKITGHDKR